MTQNLLETNFSLKLIAFELSNVRELETIKFDSERSLRLRGVGESEASD